MPKQLDGDGRLLRASGSSRTWGSGPVLQFVVEVESGLGVDPEEFATEVEAVLADPRGWTRKGAYAFRRVPGGPADLRVTLASPDLVDTLCSPLDTGGRYSCWHDGRAVLNALRWRSGAPSYGSDLANYRRYLVNHEVGHGLGYDHVSCKHPGRVAPVMLQQTKGLGGCRRNPWPYTAGT